MLTKKDGDGKVMVKSKVMVMGGSWDNSHPPSHPAPHLSVGEDFGSGSRGSNHQQLAHYN